MNHFEQGRYDTYASLGVTKTAGWAASFGAKPGWFGRMMIGRPKQFWNELKSGRAFSSKKVWNPTLKTHEMGLIRESMHAPGLLNKALWWGGPAWEAQKMLRSGSPDTAADVGGLVGSTLAFNALFGPLGVVGSGLAAVPMEAAGRAVGGLFKSKKPQFRAPEMNFNPQGIDSPGSPLTY